LKKILDDLKISIQTTVQNALLPRGSIVWFHGRTTAPEGWAICNGTNGTPNLIGRYPLGAISDIGGLVEAGLPNITGTFGGNRYYGASGAFVYAGSTNVRGSSRSGGAMEAVGFNASYSNGVYSRSTTVTPPSTKLLPCMKL
jgi:hypothetical protein